MYTQDEFSYFGDDNSDNPDEEIDVGEGDSERQESFNQNGKRVRGKDQEWVNHRKYVDPESFKSSDLLIELKENFSCKSKKEMEYGDVHLYVCKVSRRKNFEKCSKQIRLIYPADTMDVLVQETGVHEHVEKSGYESLSVFKYSAAANKVIEMCVKNHATPTVTMRHLRDQGVFGSGKEPTMASLRNKMSSMRKRLNMSENLYTTHELRNKAKEYSKQPEDDDEGWIPFCKIEDESLDKETRFLIIFTTNNLLKRIHQSKQLHVDATYRLNFQGFPVFVVGVSSATGRFYGTMTVLSSHEDSRAWTELYQFIHDQGAHFQYFMADGAKAITSAQHAVFSQCDQCSQGQRLMCYPHVHRNIRNKIGSVGSVSKKLLEDIGSLQWSSTSLETFKQVFQLLREKYEASEAGGGKISEFFKYVDSTWVSSQENLWFEGANPYGLCNNQGLEGKNKNIKDSYTMRRKMALGSFMETSIKLVHEMSLEDASQLASEKSSSLFGQSDSLKIRTDGYTWFQMHQNKKHYASIKPKGRKTEADADILWIIPSSSTSTDSNLKELGTQRLDQRYNVKSSSFDEYLKMRTSCYIVEQKGSEFFCDCYEGSKGRLCKHSVGLMYKCGVLEVTPEVRSKPLGEKRSRGRPAKPRNAFVKSPVQATHDEVPFAQYHQRSPEVSSLSQDNQQTLTIEDIDLDNIEIVVQSEVLPKKRRRIMLDSSPPVLRSRKRILCSQI